MFNGFLRQSTASQSRLAGPFLDDTDFKTTEPGLTIANTDVKLSKNAAASVNKNSGGGTHRINGKYSLTFDATDSDTVGELDYSIDVAGALIVTGKFIVLEEAVYDALYASGAAGPLQSTVAGRTLDVTATGAAGIDLANVENPTTTLGLTNTTVGTVTTNTDMRGTDNAALASVATETRMSELDAATAGKMANQVDEIRTDTEDIQTQIGAAGAGLTDLGGMSTGMKAEVNAEVVDTLATDTYTELTGVPGFPASVTTMIRRLYNTCILGLDISASKKQYLDSGGAVEWEKDIADDGTNYTETSGNAP